jgi:quercetin dioxygenase-like cupin family protein
MIGRGAKLTPDEAPALVEYLTASFGPDGAKAQAPPSSSATEATTSSMGADLIIDPDQVHFGPIPDTLGFPSGVQASVVAGDPSRTGLFSMLLKLPAGQAISPRSFSADENIVCLRGTIQFGEGATVDLSKLQTLNPGVVVHVPAEKPYFVQTKDSTIVLLYGTGPLSTMTPK